MGFSPKWNKFYSAFSEALLDAGKQLTKQGETMLTRASEKWIEKTDAEWPREWGDHDHPWYSGTLHDSISTRVADGNRTISVRYMPKAATNSQSATAEDVGRDYNNIVGSAFGRLMAGRATRVAQKGLQAQMFIGVPYAQKVDEMPRHEGYINDLQGDFVSTIEDVIIDMRNLIVRPRK